MYGRDYKYRCCPTEVISEDEEIRIGDSILYVYRMDGHCSGHGCYGMEYQGCLLYTSGSIHIADKVLSSYLYEIIKSLERFGVKRMAIINSHMGNGAAIKTAMRKAYEDSLNIKVYQFTYPEANSVIQKVCTTKRSHEILFHADEIETSYMLYLAPESVDMKKAIFQEIDFPEEYDFTSIKWSEFMLSLIHI